MTALWNLFIFTGQVWNIFVNFFHITSMKIFSHNICEFFSHHIYENLFTLHLWIFFTSPLWKPFHITSVNFFHITTMKTFSHYICESFSHHHYENLFTSELWIFFHITSVILFSQHQYENLFTSHLWTFFTSQLDVTFLAIHRVFILDSNQCLGLYCY